MTEGKTGRALEEVKFSAKNFVFQKEGKIKADYRIGACLGKGEISFT